MTAQELEDAINRGKPIVCLFESGKDKISIMGINADESYSLALIMAVAESVDEGYEKRTIN